MDRDAFVSTIESNVPFTILMADGRKYEVPRKDYVSLPPKGMFAIVYDDQGHVYMLPFRTMTAVVRKEDFNA